MIKKEGKGIYYHNNGNRYEGDWRNDKKEGKGIIYYNNGDRMMGDYSNDNQIGKHCDYPCCNQIDYLNFHCNVCGKNLCKLHYHHELSCPFAKNKEEENIKKKKLEFNYQITKCDFCKCEIKNMDPVQCQFCKKLFCLKHKLESDHDCPSTKKISIEDKHKKNKWICS